MVGLYLVLQYLGAEGRRMGAKGRGKQTPYRKAIPYCFMQQTTALMSMEANVAAWRFLMRSLAKNI